MCGVKPWFGALHTRRRIGQRAAADEIDFFCLLAIVAAGRREKEKQKVGPASGRGTAACVRAACVQQCSFSARHARMHEGVAQCIIV